MNCPKRGQEDDIENIISRLEHYLADGWSIQLALKKACGSVFNKMSLYVRRDPRYLELLNKYAAGKKLNMLYSTNEKGELYQVRTSTYPHNKKV